MFEQSQLRDLASRAVTVAESSSAPPPHPPGKCDPLSKKCNSIPSLSQLIFCRRLHHCNLESINNKFTAATTAAGGSGAGTTDEIKGGHKE